MGYNKIAELTHEMEDVLDLIRKEQLKLDEDIIDTLFKCLDSLEQMIDSVANGESEDVVDVSDLVTKLSSISKGESAPAAASAGPLPCPGFSVLLIASAFLRLRSILPYHSTAPPCRNPTKLMK